MALEGTSESSEDGVVDAPIWPAFGDLMACLFGVFVLFFVWAVAWQVEVTETLTVERASHAEEAKRIETLERMLARSLGERMDGRITVVDGHIGIGGAVLFQLASAELQPEGTALLRELAAPLADYLANDAHRAEVLMVSGFTDDLPVVGSSRGLRDNWDLSAARALTVVRALVAAGVPAERVFAAAFGETHPLVDNDTEEHRGKNRRVEIAAIPAAGQHP